MCRACRRHERGFEENRMRLRFAMVVLCLCLPGAAAQAALKQDTVRQRAEQACYNNVIKFCNDDVPDEKKIAACLGRNVSKLDPDCREIYQKGM